ncbi:uncharacterized protein LOC105168070 [Sesamum indicum]|uniref:Uncharacterized protein LOC105168070 n=1 Tax=Sesamum indicum TaxID=4182 RepID=A0A6I9TKI3_SESIN|nr:uncharacterized protein LOC105168070 [Sesamum indicum]
MEKDGRKRKRTRDQTDDQKNKESHKGKKLETMMISSLDNDSSYRGDTGYESCDAVGVFDFPWLKDGVVFEVDDYLQPEDVFAPCCSYVDDTFVANLDQSCVQNSPALDRNSHDKKCDDDSLWPSFKVDDLDSIDCIWRALIDQPLDNIGLNKA